MKYILLTIFFVTCLATGGIFVKLSEFDPITTGFYRVFFSIPLLIPLLKIENSNKLSLHYKLNIFIAGVFLGIDLSLWNISFYYTTVANANLLANLVPFTIIPASYFIYKEKVSPSFLFSLCIALIGLFILLKGKDNPSIGSFYGDVLAFMTSIAYAVFLLIVYRVRDKASALQIMYYSAYGSILVLLVASIVMEGKLHFPVNLRTLYPLFGLAIFSQILGQGGLSYILGKISANLASILVLMQPVISAIMAYIIFDELLSAQEMLGILVVLIGIFIVKKQ